MASQGSAQRPVLEEMHSAGAQRRWAHVEKPTESPLTEETGMEMRTESPLTGMEETGLEKTTEMKRGRQDSGTTRELERRTEIERGRQEPATERKKKPWEWEWERERERRKENGQRPRAPERLLSVRGRRDYGFAETEPR